MNTGRMDTYVTVQTSTTATDGIGGSIPTQATERTMWINLTPMTGFRELQYHQLVNGKPYSFKANYPEDFTFNETCLIIYGSKTLHIHSIININERTHYAEGVAYEKT